MRYRLLAGNPNKISTSVSSWPCRGKQDMSKRTDRPAPTLVSRSSSKSFRSRLGRQLWQWVTEEMRYSSGKDCTLTQEDLQMLVGGEMAGFWEHIIKHVKSSSNADVIRSNIFLNTAGRGVMAHRAGGAQGERGQIERERSQLVKEEDSLQMAVQQMQRDIAQLRETITNLDRAGSGVQGEVWQLSRGSALLAAQSQASQEMTNSLDEFARRIRARANVFRPVEKEAAYFTKPGVDKRTGEDGSTSQGLESACTHKVRTICSQLEEALSCKDSEDQRVVERKRERSWREIESLLTHHSPAEILRSLVEVTQQEAHELHSHTDAIDLNRDAQRLKYSYDVTGMHDISEQPSLLHAVEEQLLEAQLSHIQRSVESVRAQKTAREAQSQALGLQAAANQLLQELYHDSEAMELAKLNLQLDLECAGSMGSLEKLSGLCSSLGCARDQRKAAVEALHGKHAKIQEFAQVADSKQRQIQALVLHNSSGKDRLLKQTTELQVYVQQNVLSHQERLNAVVNSLRDGIAQEVQLFTGLALNRLLKTPDMQMLTCELSIRRLNIEQPSGHPSWDGILQSLKLPHYCAPDRVLTKLMDSQEKVGSLDRNVAKLKEMLQEMRGMTVDKESTQIVLQKCQDYDRELLGKGVPAVQECLSCASCALVDCEKTAETLEHWWVQPAQFLVSWATQDGLTSAQWVEQWKVLAAKFGELLE